MSDMDFLWVFFGLEMIGTMRGSCKGKASHMCSLLVDFGMVAGYIFCKD